MNLKGAIAKSLPMQAIQPPEVIRVSTVQVACDGSGEISPALGHPRVFLRIEPDTGFVECGYCDRRFELAPGADGHGHETEFADPAAFEPDEIE